MKRITKYQIVECKDSTKITVYNNLKDLIIALKKMVVNRVEFDVEFITSYRQENEHQFGRSLIYYDPLNNEYQFYVISEIPKTSKRLHSIQRKLSKIFEKLD